MFAVMIKGGAAPVKIEPSRGFSAEPLGSGISGSGAEVENFVGKEREGSSVPMDVDSPNKNEKSEKKISVDEYNERRSKRNSRHHQKYYDDSFDDEYRHSRRRQKHDTPSDDEYRHSRHRHRHDSSSDDEHRHSRRQHKHHSSDNGLEHRSRSAKNGKSQSEKEVDLEEGEILTRSDQSKASQGDGASREASVELSKSYQDGRAPSQQASETTEVSDDLRAKIRAMLMATL
ncbi:pre-mRNA-splicing factor CWC25-like [Corylus avellana]|uniref:pre-mRNA-splicing factor CWC25-like n=1 Tax=Corylus avellana TaxID=13451 RepID=UPI00286BBBF6|nr:pre-mRNA-splicing factor CWC25-like [Corylus avellana]